MTYRVIFQFLNSFNFLLSLTSTGTNPGGYLTKFNTGKLRPEVQPLTLLYTMLTDKVPLLYTFY